MSTTLSGIAPSVICLAERQHGVVAVHQLHDLGLDPVQVARLHAVHGWEQLTADVLRRTGSTPCAAQRVAAAVLDAGPGAVLSHDSAAAWWGHGGSPLERPVHVSTTRNSSRRRSLTRVHRVRRLEAQWVTDRLGVAVARPPLVALNLFAIHSYERASTVTDALWSQRLLTGRSIAMFLDVMGRRGRNGTAGLRRYLSERGEHYVPPDSGLESRVRSILDAAGIPMRRQVNSGDESVWIGRVDFRHPSLPLIVEVQSELHHTSLVDRRHDKRRIEALEAAGFEVVELTDELVWTDPAAVVAAVRAGLRRARERAA